jgi:hypothetical protein
MLCLSSRLIFIGHLPHLFLNLFVLLNLLSLHFISLATPVVEYDFPAFALSPVGVGCLLLGSLLLEESLDEVLLILGRIEALLNFPLVNQLLPISSFSLLCSKLIVILSLFDLVHSGGVREVLNLSRWNAFFLLLPLDGLFNRDVLLDTLPRHVFVELIDSLIHVRRVIL